MALVPADCVLNAVLRVPGLVAFCPWKLGLEALKEVVESPGQDHDVVDIQKRDDDNGSIADTCRQFWRKEESNVLSWRLI